MTRRLAALSLAAALMAAGCAQAPDPYASVVSITPGEIVTTEQVTSADTPGANSVVRVGSAILGVLAPGPWGSVAGAAGGEAGRAVLRNSGGQLRYIVRLPDGSYATVEQAEGNALAKGTKVDVIEMSDGSKRVVASVAPVDPASQPRRTG